MHTRHWVKALVAAVALGSVVGAGSAMAQTQLNLSQWDALTSPEQRAVDRLAAAEFRSTVSEEDKRTMEEQTALIYASATAAEQARIRDLRKREWRAMSDSERHALRSAKDPQYANLLPNQKAPFRARALTRFMAMSPAERANLAAADKFIS